MQSDLCKHGTSLHITLHNDRVYTVYLVDDVCLNSKNSGDGLPNEIQGVCESVSASLPYKGLVV